VGSLDPTVTGYLTEYSFGNVWGSHFVKDNNASTSDESVPRPLQILLLEESLVNQKLVAGTLQGQQHRVTVAVDRESAILCLASQPFDLILMDPLLPGFDGVADVARLSAVRPEPELPVVAMSVSVSADEREALLAVGVCDFLVKPVRATELLAVVQRIGDARVAKEESKAAPSTDATVNWRTAMSTVEGDYTLLVALLEGFLVDAPQLMLRMEQAVANDDLEQLHREAHTLKSGFRCFGAEQAEQLAARVEASARQRSMERIGEQVQEVKRIWPQVERTLRNAPSSKWLAQLSLDD